jgi:signal transduction histidine kinase
MSQDQAGGPGRLPGTPIASTDTARNADGRPPAAATSGATARGVSGATAITSIAGGATGKGATSRDATATDATDRQSGKRRPTSPGASARWIAAAEDAGNRWPLGRIIGVGMLALGLILVAAIIVGSVALGNLHSSRDRLVSMLDPAAFHGSQLYVALLNQETGLRGYLLSGTPSFLGPYTSGLAEQNAQTSALRPLLAGLPAARADLATTLSRAAYWRTTYAQPAIKLVAATGKPLVNNSSIAIGKSDFDKVRAPLAAFQTAIAQQRRRAAAQLGTASVVLDVIGIASALALILVVLALGVALRAAVTSPLTRLANDARRVADGEFDHQVDPSGPREVNALAVDVNRMRERILRELSAVRSANVALQARAQELERSNAELEQFAYVASHDLQEPLRKVASFCQLLQRRYIGQLDARADQYIEFAVDGAKRMQALIDDLLAFSRVGRVEREPVLVSCASALSQARVNLAAEMKRTGALVETTELPSVRAEFSLITSLFQNLLSNALKFHGQQPPLIRVTADRHEDFWLFSFSDNGIGIDAEYAERIFVIFQRLHDRTAYAGTGIGLAMCRKIVEHYGGTIWLDTSQHDGAKFCFTLPVAPVTEEENSG